MAAQYCLSCMNEMAGQVAICPYCHAEQPYKIKDMNDLPAGMILKKRYLVGRSLGRGGFGATYIARDLKQNKVLTIKEYFPEFACGRNPGSNFVALKEGKADKFDTYRAEFKAEVQHLKMLRDVPGVVQFYDEFDAFGTSYLVMTYLDGKTLKDIQLEQRRAFSLAESVDYTLRTLQVLSRVHGKRILHRDVSPDNIFITSTNQVYLIDFGSSSMLSQTTTTGTVKGVYTAPEQRINAKQTAATDLYAVGVTLFTMLMNHIPKEGEGILLETLPDTFPPGLQMVYQKATQREASMRYQSADEMARALSQATGMPLPLAPSNRKKKLRQLLTAMMALVAVLVVAMVLAFSGSSTPNGQVEQPVITATAVPTRKATAQPVITQAPSLPANAWLCATDNQLYCVTENGAQSISVGTYPVEEAQLQWVELANLESARLIYDLDGMEIVHLATQQSFQLTNLRDAMQIKLLPGQYSLRIVKDDRILAEPFSVPAQFPVQLSAASEAMMETWWESPVQATATAEPATPTPTPHVHDWQEVLVQEVSCVREGIYQQACTLCGEEGTVRRTSVLPHSMKPATCTEPATCENCGLANLNKKALGHTWMAATCELPATCSVCGVSDGTPLTHVWMAASCELPATCSLCGRTDGEPLAHVWTAANCNDPATCSLCGLTDGEPLAHAWMAASCELPATCSLCGLSDGTPLAHAWMAATCELPATCSLCGLTDGKALEHRWVQATCINPRTCNVCGETSGEAKGHNWKEATCEMPKTCLTCKWVEGSATGHAWVAATCVAPKTCRVCQRTEGEALGHLWFEATCTTPKMCIACDAAEGTALGHQWLAANCTTPKTCAVCGATEGAVAAHAFGDWHSRAAVCGEMGIEERICGDCGTKEECSVGIVQHAFGDWQVVQTPDCMTYGVSLRSCEHCGLQEVQHHTEKGKPSHAYVDGVCKWCQMGKPDVDMTMLFSF